MQDSLLRSKAGETQSFADGKDLKKFYDALKTVYGPHSSEATPLLSANRNNIMENKLSWKDGLNTSTVCSIARPVSMRMPLIDLYKLSAIHSLMNPRYHWNNESI